jgi:hypothetical protein
MYERTFRKDDQTRTFTIQEGDPAGWEVRDEADNQLVKRAFYSDWHRVERARTAFAATAVALMNAGWIEK